MRKAPFVFGLYPFGYAGTGKGVASGPPDDMRKIGEAMRALSGGVSLLPRSYVTYSGPVSTGTVLSQIALYAWGSLKWDVVLRFQDNRGDMGPWIALIRTIVRQFGTRLEALQITSEANLTGLPGAADGSTANVREALRQGMIAARQEIDASRASVKIGFSVVPNFNSRDTFWRSLPPSRSEAAGRSDLFSQSVDYVGYDMYPDVFGPPIPLKDMGAAVEALLKQLRRVDLPAAGIPASIPLRITENGWPTAGAGRTEARQAQVLEATIRAVYARRSVYNVTHFELFGLRDADSAKDDLFHRFGIVHDDYSRKPAFATYQRLIAELSSM